jgi:hypothetical protein
METKYGQLPDEMLVTYVNGMVAKIYKMMPMKEQGIKSLSKYIEATLRELVGQKELIDKLKSNEEFLSILGILEGLLNQEDFSKFRSDVFKIITLIEKLKLSLGGNSHE